MPASSLCTLVLVLIAILVAYTAWAAVFAINLWRAADRWMASRWFNPWGFPVAPARGFALVGSAVGFVVLVWIAVQAVGASA